MAGTFFISHLIPLPLNPKLTHNFSMKKIFTLAAACAIVLSAGAQDLPLKDYIGYELPSAAEANPSTYNYPNVSYKGLGLISLALKDASISFNTSSKAKITLSLMMDGDPIELASLGIADLDSQLQIIQIGALADDDLPTFEPSASLFMIFDPNWQSNPNSYFQMDGYTYRLEIPAGILKFGDKNLSAATIDYTWSNKAPENLLKYTLKPDPSQVVENLKTISITFPEAGFVDYKKDGGGQLKDPNGNVIPYTGGERPTGSYTKTLTYNYTGVDSWENGAYTFSIAKGILCVDQFEDDVKTGNFDGLTVVYNVQSNSSVTVLGLEAADTYTVYTLAGVKVVEGAKADALLDLAPGFYIINGSKVLVK